MARYMRDTGVLARLGVEDRLPEPAKRVHKALGQHSLGHARVVNADGAQLQRFVTPSVVKYVALPSKEKEKEKENQEEECRRMVRQQQRQQPIIVIV